MQAARNVAARATLVIGALVFGAAAQAQSLSARAGSNGLGAELSAGFGSMFGMRANVLGGSYDRDEVQSDIRYEGQLKLSNAALLLDLHPLSGTFRLSAGLVYNDNQLDATGRGDGGTIVINGISYAAADVGTLQAAVRWDKASPYVGFGWGTKPAGTAGLFLSADVGAFYMKPTASLTGTCGASLPTPVCDQLQADVRAEEREFRDEVNKYKLYPVLSVGVGYRF
jgi:hypothetical protein